ncbi:uncharacterized protein PV07_12594 [Cladophialophora immunda]|uniref:Uncharacterized protein n=1 Tax=Cladophialophora immunda TaxID=569365 RepID=A0A0D2CES2_9EURO|nr:uncharacterized protein PV07_12594 [Cladophialophora immunda]KIW22009.1 hypothetical protein PV07_12594 [Cladophialophora immunda]
MALGQSSSVLALNMSFTLLGRQLANFGSLGWTLIPDGEPRTLVEAGERSTDVSTVTATSSSVVLSTTFSSPATTATTASGYLPIVQKWRSAGGLPTLTPDSQREANALKTSTDSVSGLQHELNPGTTAQVLAPGGADDFENVYVGG